jgi:hypothetical protein
MIWSYIDGILLWNPNITFYPYLWPLFYENGGFESLFYEATSWPSSPGLNGLTECNYNACPVGPVNNFSVHICSFIQNVNIWIIILLCFNMSLCFSEKSYNCSSCASEVLFYCPDNDKFQYDAHFL